jgi:hypothetical protein
MKVEVVHALPDRHLSVVLEVAEATTAAEALLQSGLLQSCPDLAQARLSLGVFGRRVAPDHRLRDGDRVEVLRPLQADPKDARRRLAATGKAMGRRRAD